LLESGILDLTLTYLVGEIKMW